VTYFLKPSARLQWIGIVLTTALIVVFLAPTLQMPFLGDDTFNSYLDGWIGFERLSPFHAFTGWVAAGALNGRFYPVYPVLLFFEFHLIHSVLVIKILVLAAMLLNALTLYMLLRLCVPALALPAAMLLPATWQIRFFHDPIVQFSLHMQVTLEFVLLGLIALVRFARRGKWWDLGLALGAQALANLTYEPTYPLVFVFVLVAVLCIAKRSQRIVAALALVIPPLVCMGVVFILRLRHPLPANDQHALHPALVPFLHAFGNQLLGALPLSYRIFDPHDAFVGTAGAGRTLSLIVGILAFAGVVVAYARRPSDREGRGISWAFIVALVGCLSSAIIVALSPRWQAQLAPGLAYLPVYLEYPCIAVALAAVGYTICRLMPAGVGVAVVSLGAAAIICATYQANAQTLEHYAPWNVTMPAALDAGLLRQAHDGASIYLDDSYPAQAIFTDNTWNARYYLYFHTGKRFGVFPLARLTSAGNDSFVVRGTWTGFRRGTAVAGRVARVVNVEGARQALVEDVVRFERAPGVPDDRRRWRSRCGAVAIDSVLSGTPTGLVLAYGPAFYAPEHDADAVWRWSSANAEIDVENPTSRPRYARLKLTIRPVQPAIRVRVLGAASSHKAGEFGDVLVDDAVRVVPGGRVAIRFLSPDAARIRPPDTRPLLFQIRDMHLIEPACT
jgi:hypothetical protein